MLACNFETCNLPGKVRLVELQYWLWWQVRKSNDLDDKSNTDFDDKLASLKVSVDWSKRVIIDSDLK